MREYNCIGRGLIVPETDESPEAEKARGFLLTPLQEREEVKTASNPSAT